MKKVFLWLLLPVFSFAQPSISASKSKSSFIINGNIKGLPDSTLIFLGVPGEANEVLATSYSKGGKFTLFGNVDNPDVCILSFIGQKDNLEIFIDPSQYNITGNVKVLKSAAVTGSVANKDYQQYLANYKPLKTRLNSLVTTINATPQSPKRDSLIRLFEVAKTKVVDQVKQFVKLKPASPVSPFLIYVTSPASNDVAALQARYNMLSPSLKENTYARKVEEMIASTKIGMVGTQAVNFTQNDTANKPVSLSSLRGKYVLVDFWASWCGPCRNENPNVVAAYNTYKNKNFTVLGVSLDQVKEKWIAAIQADNLTWTHVSDLKYWSNEVAALYKIGSIPANMLIDPNGKIIGRDLRGEQLQSTLKQLLK